MLTFFDVNSRYKVARALSRKKGSEVGFALEAICEHGGDYVLW